MSSVELFPAFLRRRSAALRAGLRQSGRTFFSSSRALPCAATDCGVPSGLMGQLFASVNAACPARAMAEKCTLHALGGTGRVADGRPDCEKERGRKEIVPCTISHFVFP